MTANPTTAESSSSQEVVQQAFHQHLRDQIRGAVQVVMEDIMREELTQFLGAQWGECSPERKGYRNVRRRTDQIDTFTTETSCLSIVWAVMQGIRLSKISVW